MKKLLTLLFICMAISVQASQALWVGIDENATIGNSGMTVSSWLNSLEDPDSASFRIRIGNTILSDSDGIENGWIGYPGDGYISPGQKQNQYAIPDNIADDTVITYEIGESEYDSSIDDYVWIFTVGYAQDTYGNLYAANHTYTIGTISEPSETDWIPVHFYTDIPVPEPSITIFAILGACAMLLRRK